MLCYGLLAALVAALVGMWRRLGAFPGRLLLGLAALIGVPAVAYGFAGDNHISRADLIAQSMQTLCGS